MINPQIEYKRYDAHDKQSVFHNALRQYSVVLFNGGRGSGKTTSGAIQSIIEATEQPGERGLIVAPTYPMLRDATMAEFFKWLPRHMIAKWNKSEKNLILKNGSEITFRSADNPDSLRGANRAWLWFDEPRNIRTREAFDIAYAQLREGDKRAWLTTTPSGIFHWIYELFVVNPIPDSTYVTVKTSENPFLPEDYEQSLRAQYTGQFAAQELDAAFVSFEGLIYDNFSITDNVTTDADYNPNLDVYWGVDDGYAHGGGKGTAGFHPRAIILCQVQEDGSLYVFDEYYRTLQLPEATINELIERPYHLPQLAKVDSSAAELRRRLHEAGIMSGGATHRVVDGIKVVRRFICDGNGVRLLKIHPRCKNLIRELQTYRYDDKGNRVEAGEPKPLKMDDHLCDALRYIIWNFR
jgi:PBSX family phage terminase large subunit